MAAPRPRPPVNPDEPRHEGGEKSGEAAAPPPAASPDKPDEGAADRGREGGMIGEG
ncbi:MAG: hypothetical protein Q8M88_03420 [Phenylobacterium sp.]|uniref:hypothetical protein n=1 Tax=Phenylobacterium sp. TaxID=1871053 RepID=UPI002735B912|nr:hypothetical protein [Phenylobacterium sp.]MDP3173466.1 hypothetical protein [Phenylobacterium sp.]